MGSVSLIFLFFAGAIVGLFTQQSEVKSFGVTALRIISGGFIFYGIGMVLINSFNGAGDTKTPTMINLFCFWLFQIPLAYVLAKYFGLGPTGVFISIPVAETFICIAAFILFKKGRWKLVKI
jgi:Na+-driven multidrug efflux pump